MQQHGTWHPSAVILPNASSEEARRVAEDIRSRSSEFCSVSKGLELDFRLTSTIGVATFPDDGGTPNALFRVVDSHLYER